MPQAARVGDMHTCPIANPDGSPHTGGPIMPPGISNVLIEGMPAATMSSLCTCVGPPDNIALGSATVLIGGQQAARVGDITAHGGQITAGAGTVLIGG